MQQFERVPGVWLPLRAARAMISPAPKDADPMLAQPLAAIHVARPGLGLFPRAIVEAIMLVEGPIGSADSIAKALGLHSRFQLARMLKRAGLPPLHVMAEWATVLSWVMATERHGVSLCGLAFRSRRHPSACYRLVKEVTGLCWEDVRARGAAWVQRQFLNEFQDTATARRTV